MLKIAILIPAYNVHFQLSTLLCDLTQQFHNTDIVVIDDGSSDGMFDALGNRFSQVVFLQHDRNRGKGAALKTGIKYVGSHLKVDAIAFMDGDGQHPASALKKIIRIFEDKKATFVIGRRAFSLKVMPWPRILSNTITSCLVSLKIGAKVHDSQCGFRLIEHELIQKIMPLQADGYNFETELLIKAGKAGAIIADVDIPTIYANEKSNIRPLRDSVRFLRTYFSA